VAGKGSVTVRDVLVGEVWIAAGQANMEHTLEDTPPSDRVDAAAAASGGARYPLIRQFRVAPQAASSPQDVVGGDWKVCSPQTLGRFSAVGFFFARDLHTRLSVPVGIINVTWAVAPIESWEEASSAPPATGASRATPSAGGSSLAADPRQASAVFNGMIHPLLPYGIRGAIWYDGEGDVGHASQYAARFQDVIQGWRARFGQGDFPFLWVQLANFRPQGSAGVGQWALMREAQAQALALPATGQAVAIDIGEPGNPHPGGKAEVARRLALIAKANVYSIPEDFSGPVFRDAHPEGGAMRVHFLFAGEGLTASGRPLQAFEVAGADHVFHPATASIDGDGVLVRCPSVAQPQSVRYAWSDSPDANLYNGAGLPAAPFRSK